jgi:hypothetical protein
LLAPLVAAVLASVMIGRRWRETGCSGHQVLTVQLVVVVVELVAAAQHVNRGRPASFMRTGRGEQGAQATRCMAHAGPDSLRYRIPPLGTSHSVVIAVGATQ